jgi:hypothetical protein
VRGQLVQLLVHLGSALLPLGQDQVDVLLSDVAVAGLEDLRRWAGGKVDKIGWLSKILVG